MRRVQSAAAVASSRCAIGAGAIVGGVDVGGEPPAGDEGEAEANVSSRCRHGDASAERTIGRAEVEEGASGGRFPKGTRRAIAGR